MRKVLLTFGSILSIALSVGVSVSCGTRTSTPTREVNPSIGDLENKAGDIKTPKPMDENNKEEKQDKPAPQVHLLDSEKTKEEQKDQGIEQARAEALSALSGYLELSDKQREEYRNKITIAKTKEEIRKLGSEAARKSGIV